MRGCVLGVDPAWIVAGNGSDDLLTMLFRSVADAERPVAFPAPTYSLYRTLARMQALRRSRCRSTTRSHCRLSGLRRRRRR